MILTRRDLNRATLARQSLLGRTDRPVARVVEELVGLQAQTPQTWYTGMWSRVADFAPESLSGLLEDRRVVRMALMRSTIHLVTAEDAWGLRTLLQPVLERMTMGTFRRRLEGIDLDALGAAGREIVEERPVTFKELGERLLVRWPDHDALALSMWVRAVVPLVQVPPRGLWGRSGAVAHTSIEAWLGTSPPEPMSVDALVRRYLAAFGPASVMDAQAWCGLTRLGTVFERLRPDLVTFVDERGRELFDLADAPRPDAATQAPPRFMYDFDNLFLSHADRTRAIDGLPIERLALRDNISISVFTNDGMAAGIWTIERGTGRRGPATLVITPLIALTRADRSALETEGEALLRFAAADAADHDVRFVDLDWLSPV
jgi:hypothetical protein